MIMRNAVSNTARNPGRNALCVCGSGRKSKLCCAGKDVAIAPAPQQEQASIQGERKQIRALRDAGRFVEAIRLAESHVARHFSDTATHNELGLLYLHAGRTAEAISPLWQAVRLEPNNASHHYNLGCALELLGHRGDAIARFRKAVQLAPHDPHALERLGNLLLVFDQRAEAVALFRRAVAVAPETVAGRLNDAKILVEESRAAEAEASLRQTMALHPAAAEVKRMLATILREQGRFDEAVALLEQATEGDALQASNAYAELAHSKRVTADDQPMLDQMQALLEQPTLPEKYRVSLHFGLCKSFNDLGRYEDAMRHADSGNQLARRGTAFDRAHYGASVNRMIQSFTRDSLAGASGSDCEMPVFILGMPRSGTTLVEQIVSSHPEIGAAGELTFWNREAAAFRQSTTAGHGSNPLARMASAYEALLQQIAPGARRVTDKAPGNFLWIGLIHMAFPRARFIHCRRHPVDTCLSNYFTNFAASLPFTHDKGDLAFYYRWYERLMLHWHATLPPGVLLDVDYEELVAEPERVTRRMIDFIGLPWSDACLRPQDNRNAVRTASMWQVRQATYRSSTERWRRYEPWLGELRSLLEPPNTRTLTQPLSTDSRLLDARRLRDAGRLDEAIARLQEAMRDRPHDPVVYSDLGTVCLMANRIVSAVDCFEKAIGLCPQFATAHYNLGAALERQGLPLEAARALRQAIAFAPSMGAAYSRLGNLLQTAGEHDEALACFRRAADLSADPGERELEEAKLLLANGQTADAEPKLRRVIEHDPANSLAQTMLGISLSELGQFDEAVERLRHATRLDPQRVAAWYHLAVMSEFSNDEPSLIEPVRGLLDQPGRTDFEQTMLHFALGKLLDQRGDHAAAIRHFDQANSLERARLPFDRAGFAAEIDQLIDTFTPERLARDASLGASSELPLLIIGMPRSGTTLVEQILSSHRQVGAGGELTFWSQRRVMDDAGATDGVSSNAHEYLDLLRRLAPDASRVTDKNPFNILQVGAIHLALPNARFIHCRRDAVDTCLSIYFTRFARSYGFDTDRGDLAFYYRQYLRLMAHWRSVLPPGRLLEVDYETIVVDPESETRRIVAYCGLDWDTACLAPERNPRVVRTASVRQVRQPVYRGSVGRWRNYAAWLGELAELQA